MFTGLRQQVSRRSFLGGPAMLLPLPVVSSCSASRSPDRRGAAIPLPGRAPLVVPAVNGHGARLVTVSAPRTRLKLTGLVVFGVRDFVTENGSFHFGTEQYVNRVATCRAIAAWGGNHIRLRVLADEYDRLTLMKSRATYLQWVKNWVQAASSAGLYTQICWWDSLDSHDGTKNGAHWAHAYSYAFPMMTAVHRALRRPDGTDDPMVYYEPFNEPNSITWGQWLTAMKATVALWRSTNHYGGLLMIDTVDWSHGYSDTYMGMLENYDASISSSGRHNLAFCRHDYSADYARQKFDEEQWLGATGGTKSKHVIHESEFGNSSVADTDSSSWSNAVCSYFSKHLFERGNIAGATAFLYGPWADVNRMSRSWPGTDRTSWGMAASTMMTARGATTVPTVASATAEVVR